MNATDTQREYRVTSDCKRLIFEDGTELSVIDDSPFANSDYYHQPPQTPPINGRFRWLFARV